MKPIIWTAGSRKAMAEFPEDAKREAGFQLDRVQRGKEPHDWKPMGEVGAGVNEIRIHCSSEYRVLYVAKFDEAVYVLHVFVKKTQKTPKPEIDLAAQRYRQLLAERKRK